MAKELRFKAGDIIFKEGYPSDHAYIIVSGKVEIFQEREGKKQNLATLCAGEMFGEYGVLDDKPRSASAGAVEDTVLQIMEI